MIGVECIARGYLAGLGLESYRASGSVSGVELPAGLAEGSELPEPVFTPTTKAAAGEHDEFIGFAEVVAEVGQETAERLRELTLAVYRHGQATARGRGVIIADTKLEFGRAADGTLVLADEVLTPDSSRFWPASEWQPGRTAALPGQAVRAGLGGRLRLGQAVARARAARRGGGGHQGQVRRGIRAHHRRALEMILTWRLSPRPPAGYGTRARR